MKCAFALLLLLQACAWAEPTTDRMVQIARQEWEFFGKQTIGKDGKISHPGHKEADEGYWQRVGVYWRNGVFENFTGKDTDEAWSAAFMSTISIPWSGPSPSSGCSPSSTTATRS